MTTMQKQTTPIIFPYKNYISIYFVTKTIRNEFFLQFCKIFCAVSFNLLLSPFYPTKKQCVDNFPNNECVFIIVYNARLYPNSNHLYSFTARKTPQQIVTEESKLICARNYLSSGNKFKIFSVCFFVMRFTPRGNPQSRHANEQRRVPNNCKFAQVLKVFLYLH